MVGAVVATWFAARRFVGTTGAWIAAVVMVANPYAIRYATEARMYSLEMLLVASGIVAFQRALEQPTPGRLALVALLVALFLYTQYWSFYLLVVVVGAARLDGVARSSSATRRAACSSRWPSAASPSCRGCRRSSTSARTPARRGARRCCPGIPLGYTLRDFAGGASGTAADRQEGWLLFFILLPMLMLGVVRPRAIDERRIEIDLHMPRESARDRVRRRRRPRRRR